MDWLVEWGYSRDAEVDAAGQFAARGGIIDIFPPTADRPLRVEFFGDEIESIRGFEVSSQASITRHTEDSNLSAWTKPASAASSASLRTAASLTFVVPGASRRSSR